MSFLMFFMRKKKVMEHYGILFVLKFGTKISFKRL